MAFNFWLDQAAQVPPDQAQINNAVLANGVPEFLAPNPVVAAPVKNAIPAMLAANPGQAPLPTAMRKPAAQKPLISAALAKYMPQTTSSNPLDAGIEAQRNMSKQALADQAAQLSGLNQYINDMAAKPRGVDFSALAAYVDGATGSKLAPTLSAMAPMSQDDKDKMLFGLRNQLAQGQANLSAAQQRSLKEEQDRIETKRHQDEIDRHNLAMENKPGTATANGTGLSRLQGAIDRTEAVYDKDPIITTAMNRRNQIATDYHTLTAPGAIINVQTLHELTGGIASALQNGKSAGLGQQQMQSIRDTQTQLAGILDFVTTNPHTALSEGQRVNLTKILDRLDSAYGQIQASRAEQLHRGRQFVIPEARQASEQKYQSYKDSAKAPVFDKSAESAPTDQHAEAVKWAKANPTDPRAISILKINGG